MFQPGPYRWVDWGAARGGEHASADPCNLEYAGPSDRDTTRGYSGPTGPFSAAETRAIRDFVGAATAAAGQSPKAAMDVHSYSQAWSGAYGSCSTQNPPSMEPFYPISTSVRSHSTQSPIAAMDVHSYSKAWGAY